MHSNTRPQWPQHCFDGYKCPTNSSKPIKRKIYLWKWADKSSMSEDLKEFTEEFTHANTTETEVNTLWTSFKQKCIESVNKYVPFKYTSTRFNQPWCNRDVRRLTRRKRWAYRKARTSKNPSDWMKYKEVQKDAQKTCRSAHNNYIRNMVSEPGSNNKKLYSYVKGMKCDSSGVATLKRDGTNYSEASDKAEILNNQFASDFTREDCSTMQHHAFHGKKPRNRSSTTGYTKQQSQEDTWRLKPAQGKRPRWDLFALPEGDGTQHISIPSTQHIACPHIDLSSLLRSRHSTHRLERSLCNPTVSLTSICSKAMEHIIHSHLMKYLDSHHILSDQQHGLRKRQSCESQLITTVHELASWLDKSQQINANLLDFSKAFDKVAHRRLANKLHHYGIRNKTLAWI